jgi:hypothetical protein
MGTGSGKMKRTCVRVLLVVLALSVGGPWQAIAQELAPGARVRVTLIERAPLVGTLVALPPAGLEIRFPPDSTVRTILRPDIERLEISDGTRSRVGRGAVRGALIVGGIGALGGFLLGMAPLDVEMDQADFVGIGLVGGGLLGAGLGALMTAGRYEKWKRVPVPDQAP